MSVQEVAVLPVRSSRSVRRSRADAGGSVELPSYLGDRRGGKKGGSTIVRTGNRPSLASARTALNDTSFLREYGTLRKKLTAPKTETAEVDSSGKFEIVSKFKKELQLEGGATKELLDTARLKFDVALRCIEEERSQGDRL